MVKSIVCIKYAIDINQLRLDSTSKAPVAKGVARRISDIDKNAIEEAVRMKEKHGGEVVVLTVGPPEAKEALREALAIGADQAYLITDPSFENLDTGGVSAVLASAASKLGSYDLILTGEATVDSFSSQVGPRLAEHLTIPQVTYARKLAYENGKITAERDLEDSHEVVETNTPALVTVTKEMNTPRFPSLMAILAASKKEIKTLSTADLSVPADVLKPSIEILEIVAPEIKRKGIIIRDKPAVEMANELAQIILKERVGG